MKIFKSSEEVLEYGEPNTYKKNAEVEAVQIHEDFLIETTVNDEHEATFTGHAGDYVCIGIEGEVWRVEQRIFEDTYDLIKEWHLPKRDYFRVFDSKLVFDAFFKIAQVDYEYYFGGRWVTPPFPHLIFERGDAAALVVHNVDNGTVELVNQFRLPIYAKSGGNIYELPAGMIDEGETHWQTNVRELQEELGYDISQDRLEFISAFYVSPGGSSERIFVDYVAVTNDDLTSNGGGLKYESEHIERVALETKNIRHAIDVGTIKDAKTIIGLEWLLANKF